MTTAATPITGVTIPIPHAVRTTRRPRHMRHHRVELLHLLLRALLQLQAQALEVVRPRHLRRVLKEGD